MLNFYDLFEKVAFRTLGVEYLDHDAKMQLRSAHSTLCEAFHGSEPVDYSDKFVRAAYMLCFAPRYAIFWQELYRLNEFRFGFTRLRSPVSGVLRLNCIGSGPGSEIAGIAAAGISGLARMDLNVIDRESAWLDALILSLIEIKASLGIDFPILFHEPQLEDLEAKWPVVGSFVLSDVARQGDVENFLAKIASSAKTQPAMFMDTYEFRDSKGEAKRLEESLGMTPDWTVNLHKCSDLQAAVSQQFDSSKRLDWQAPSEDPKVAVFKFRFR